MKQDLQTAVNNWINQRFISEAKNVEVKTNPVAHGELLLILNVVVHITFRDKTVRVEKTKFFYTQENSSLEANSPGDCYRFHREVTKLDEAFYDKYEATLDDLFGDQDGFVNP